ncbi:MAG: hypothetical protein QG608_548 [Actinomycetota bacterium]|nr:hypothetical protein [Actinomycetota bacterium]
MASRADDRHRFRRAGTAIVGLSALAALLWGAFALARPDHSGSEHSGSERTLPDSTLVSCLDPDQRARLVAAAITLDLAQEGTAADRLRSQQGDRTVGQWRHDRPGDFRRACLALVEARSLDKGPVRTSPAWTAVASAVLPSLLTLVAGSLLTASVTLWQRPVRLGAQLRERGERLQEHVQGYLASPSEERFSTLRDSRRTLAETLGQVRDLRSGWVLPEALERLVASRGPLGDDLHDYYATKSRSEWTEARAEADRVRRETDRWACALGRPYRPHLALRRHDRGEGRP